MECKGGQWDFSEYIYFCIFSQLITLFTYLKISLINIKTKIQYKQIN